MNKLKIILISVVSGIFLSTNTLSAQETWDLQKCIDYAMQNHPLIRQTAIDNHSADWRLKQAKANLLPELNANINHSYSLGSTINPNTNAREPLNVQYDQFYVDLGIDLFNWKNFLNIGLQKLNKSSFVYRLQMTKNQLTLDIVQDFYAYQNAKAWREVLEDQIAGIDEQIERTQKEVEIGTRPQSDIYDIKANMGNIQEQYLDAEKNEKWAKLNLLQRINLNKTDIEFITNDKSTDLNLWLPEDMVEIVDNQPQINHIKQSIKMAEQKIKINKAQALPQLSAQYRWSTFYSAVLDRDDNLAFDEQLNSNRNQYIGVGLYIPIFNKRQVQTQTALAKNEKEEYLLNLEKTTNDLSVQLQKIIEAYQKSVEKYVYIQDNFKNQKLSFERSQDKFNEGLIDAYTFFMIRNNWLSANYNLIQSRNEMLMQQKLLEVFIK